MQAEKLRPRATNLITGVWAGQVVVAMVWVGTSLVDGASFWVWPFGATWAVIGALLAARSRQLWVDATDYGITVKSGFGPAWSWTWDNIAEVTPEPPGPLVTHLAVVGSHGQVAVTPLAKADDRLADQRAKRAPRDRAVQPPAG